MPLAIGRLLVLHAYGPRTARRQSCSVTVIALTSGNVHFQRYSRRLRHAAQIRDRRPLQVLAGTGHDACVDGRRVDLQRRASQQTVDAHRVPLTRGQDLRTFKTQRPRAEVNGEQETSALHVDRWRGVIVSRERHNSVTVSSQYCHNSIIILPRYNNNNNLYSHMITPWHATQIQIKRKKQK